MHKYPGNVLVVACLVVLFINLTGAEGGFAGERSDSPIGPALKHADTTARNGLCLYLGAPDGRSLAQMATGCRLQVQGVVSDRERAQRLRGDLRAEKNADRLSVHWRRTAHLPYLDDLIDLVLAEGWGTET